MRTSAKGLILQEVVANTAHCPLANLVLVVLGERRGRSSAALWETVRPGRIPGGPATGRPDSAPQRWLCVLSMLKFSRLRKPLLF